MTPRTFTDTNGYHLTFDNGQLDAPRGVTLTLDAASNLASWLLQWTSQNRVVERG